MTGIDSFLGRVIPTCDNFIFKIKEKGKGRQVDNKIKERVTCEQRRKPIFNQSIQHLKRGVKKVSDRVHIKHHKPF